MAETQKDAVAGSWLTRVTVVLTALPVSFESEMELTRRLPRRPRWESPCLSP